MLSEYLTDTRDLLRDSNAQFYSSVQLTRFVNKARRQTAMTTTCVRVLVAGGAAYGSDATVGTAVVGGVIPGAIGNPQGASACNTIPGQERYPFSYFNPLVRQQNGGVKGIINVMSVSTSWGSMRPTLRWMPWEEFQAYLRAGNSNMQSYPSVFSHNASGAGENGELWLWPIPGTVQEMELLTACVPMELNSDNDPEAIPDPFRSAVPFYAAKLACINGGMRGTAQAFEQDFMAQCQLAWSASDRGQIPDMYAAD